MLPLWRALKLSKTVDVGKLVTRKIVVNNQVLDKLWLQYLFFSLLVSIFIFI